MASLSEVTSGTHTPSGLDTEETLTTQTTADVFVLKVNVTNMASGDTVILRAKAKVVSAGSAALEQQETLSGAQTEKVVAMEVASPHSVAFTLEQTDGTARAFEWSILKVV